MGKITKKGSEVGNGNRSIGKKKSGVTLEKLILM